MLYRHNVNNGLLTLLTGRENYLDNLIKKHCVNSVLTIFGPSKWIPKVPHLCGFARAQLVLKDSPYYDNISLKEKLIYKIWEMSFKRCSNVFYTENESISEKLRLLLKGKTVYTVTNYYNQVFDEPGQWDRSIVLPPFSGITCLSVSTYYPHKNFTILVDVINNLKVIAPDYKVRFVLTFERNEMPVPNEMADYFVFVGKVDVSECPFLYEQSDIMFMPTLMECFTATYPEAMKMEKPIVTTDLEFARGLCGDAACYYSATDSRAAAESIIKVATDREYSERLVKNGIERLKAYDNYIQRTNKLIAILQSLNNNPA